MSMAGQGALAGRHALVTGGGRGIGAGGVLDSKVQAVLDRQ